MSGFWPGHRARGWGRSLPPVGAVARAWSLPCRRLCGEPCVARSDVLPLSLRPTVGVGRMQTDGGCRKRAVAGTLSLPELGESRQDPGFSSDPINERCFSSQPKVCPVPG